MNPLVTITAAELQTDSSARLWALVMYLAKHPEAQNYPDLRPFWLAYSYDAEVQNGGHLQYFHNCGTGTATETMSALHDIKAHTHAALLAECWNQVKQNPVARVASLQEYSSLAAERSFTAEDSAYFQEEPAVLQLLESSFDALLKEYVAVSA